jgi:hypothetical protein
MFVANPYLQLLLAILIFLWPFFVIFPMVAVRSLKGAGRGRLSYFMISLDLMIRLISSITCELTYTVQKASH